MFKFYRGLSICVNSVESEYPNVVIFISSGACLRCTYSFGSHTFIFEPCTLLLCSRELRMLASLNHVSAATGLSQKNMAETGELKVYVLYLLVKGTPYFSENAVIRTVVTFFIRKLHSGIDHSITRGYLYASDPCMSNGCGVTLSHYHIETIVTSYKRQPIYNYQFGTDDGHVSFHSSMSQRSGHHSNVHLADW